MQCLYQWESTDVELDTVFDRFWRSQPEPDEIREFAERLVRGTVAAVDRIDPLLEHQASNWRLERMGRVDRNILRLGAYELLNEPDTPPAVVIDEAIELAKRFSGEQAGQFVNGILDGVRQRLETDGIPDDAPEPVENSSEVGG